MSPSPSHRLAVLALLTTLVDVPGLCSGASLPRWWLLAIGLPLVVIPNPRHLAPAAAAGLVIAIIWAVILAPWAPLTGLLDLYFLAVITLAIVVAAHPDVDVDPAITAMCAGVVVSSIIAAGQGLGIIDPWGSVRPVGLFLNSEVLAETAAPLLIYALARGKIGLVIALIPAIVFPAGRIALVAVALGVGLIAYRHVTYVARRWVVPVIVIIAVVGVMVLTALGGIDRVETLTERFNLWVEAIGDLTMVGHGLGWWAATHAGFGGWVHSEPLQYIVELGLPGLGIFVVPVILLTRGTSLRSPHEICLVVLAVEAVVSLPLHLPVTALLWALLVGGLARARNLSGLAGCLIRTYHRTGSFDLPKPGGGDAHGPGGPDVSVRREPEAPAGRPAGITGVI